MTPSPVRLKTSQQLFLLLVLLTAGFLLAIIILWGIMPFFPGSNDPQNLLNNTSFAKVSQVIQVFSMMFVPSLLFFRMVGNPEDLSIFNRPDKTLLFVFALLMMVSTIPFIDWLSSFNQNLHLPSSLSGVESWAQAKEKELLEYTKVFLSGDGLSDILINVSIMVIIPAFCEELLFRGVVQQKLAELWNNHHYAILVTAFIFSAIHMQFLTFLPRFALGIILGYLLYYGKSIWLPIAAHFLNNAIALCSYYYLKLYRPDVDPFSNELAVNNNALIILSIALTGLLIYYYRKLSRTNT
jgi:membrane protease YdiL (CAAX protease family)